MREADSPTWTTPPYRWFCPSKNPICSDTAHIRAPRARHLDDGAIRHALDHAITVVDLELADDVNLVIHALPLRPTFYDLLPQPGEEMP